MHRQQNYGPVVESQRMGVEERDEETRGCDRNSQARARAEAMASGSRLDQNQLASNKPFTTQRRHLLLLDPSEPCTHPMFGESLLIIPHLLGFR